MLLKFIHEWDTFFILFDSFLIYGKSKLFQILLKLQQLLFFRRKRILTYLNDKLSHSSLCWIPIGKLSKIENRLRKTLTLFRLILSKKII